MDFSDKNKAFAWKRKNTIFTFLFRLSMKNAPFFNFPSAVSREYEIVLKAILK